MTILDERPPTETPTTDRDPVREALLAWLPRCRAETIQQLTETVRVRTVRLGERIYTQGDPVPLTVILEGYGAARRTTISGKELVSGVAPAGVLFGWSGITAVPSSIELVALTECRVAQWPGPMIRTLASSDPELALAAIDSMSWSLHQTVERIEGFLHQDARLRVVRVLVQHRELFFGENPVLTRAHLHLRHSEECRVRRVGSAVHGRRNDLCSPEC